MLCSCLRIRLLTVHLPPRSIMSLCGFESVRNLDYVESPWCAVFSKEEWKQVRSHPVRFKLEQTLTQTCWTRSPARVLLRSYCCLSSARGFLLTRNPPTIQDLDKYYAHGDGSPYGKVSGIVSRTGLLHNLVCRLTVFPLHTSRATSTSCLLD